MGCVARAVPTAFLHINLLLMLFAGAILSAAARLKWDPSAYIAARELFSLEYRTAAVMLPASGFSIMLLAHLALTALRCRRLSLRRVLLILYATTTFLVVWCEVVWGCWVTYRVLRWMRGKQAAELRHALQLSDHLHPLLQHLAHYHPLPEKVNQLMEEAEKDLPSNVYVLACASGIMVGLQALSAALALLAARGARRPRARALDAHSTVTTTTPLSCRRGDGEKSPLRAVYRNGRLVMV
ncbi:uncharacterized protein LOC113404397 isoform X1 [Vanessa tameamea]|uniref:Uncharacterized protein LOC113404397 isoform X1 n=1 Tax=Vanessa tameamea TaxID=334116 RepID=A0A8B8IWT9_VANTA|nr:uncharacterized protein LOC113404397 isoform X1 [Vanessa tameamea]XP_026501057.1 uncharacterized protein LOC113404397 isoform X1 [Vanessa tameamea]XP_047530947.1 uncharacterized protein LOC125066745 [Vanessa atalanta]